jgi:pimeloyl-ACP methyl ester carboxylesterase
LAAFLEGLAIPIDATFTGEPSLALLIGLALVFRLAGAAARNVVAPLANPAGWLLCACAAWLANAAAGGFAPLGLALLVGGLFSFVDHFERRAPVRAVGELAVVVACGYTSIPVPAASALALTGAAVVLAGAAIDRIVEPLARAAFPGAKPTHPPAPTGGSASVTLTMTSTGSRLAQVAMLTCALLPLWLWIAHGLTFPQQRAEFLQEKWPQIRPVLGPFFAVARANVGEPVELPGGAVGWLTLPPGPPPYRPALLFHGADDEGAYQRGALFLRRALLGLGHAVLAVDAPGYGASAAPRALRDLEAWDPEPLSVAAAHYLVARPDVQGSVLAVGHSMGATRALRFLDVWVVASGAVILGATVMPPAADDERLYNRLLADLDLEESSLTPDLVLSVRNRYFNNDAAAGALREGHAPVLFVRFAFEYANIIEGRSELYAMIPGRKVQWELATDHQFHSSRVAGVLLGDWQTMRRLQSGLRRFLDGRAPRDGSKLPFTPRR